MSEWQLIKTETLRKVENAAHDLKDISHTLEIVACADDIIMACNEAVSCNVKPEESK